MKTFGVFERTRSLLERRRRARRFGISYTRDRDWSLPNAISINGTPTYLALPDDRGTSIALKDIFVSDVYGLEELRSNPPNSILDVGAHVGLFSLAARLYFPNATIHAYEPNPALWNELRYQGNLGSFQVFTEAVHYFKGRADLRHPGDTVFTQTVINASGDIAVTSIQEAVARLEGTVDLLKLDCEGAEWDILADRVTMRRVKNLSMEYHLTGSKHLRTLTSLLEHCAFKIDFQQSDGVSNGRIRASRT